MATISDIQPPSKAPSFSAKLDRSNPLGFVEKALAFLARESDFFHGERVEREVALVVRSLREKEKKKVERKKKDDAEAAKLMEISEKKLTSETSSSSKRLDFEELNSLSLLADMRKAMEELGDGQQKLKGAKKEFKGIKRVKAPKDFYPVASRYYNTLKNNPPQEDSSLLHQEVYAGQIHRKDEHEIKECEREWYREMRAHRKICDHHNDTCCDYL